MQGVGVNARRALFWQQSLGCREVRLCAEAQAVEASTYLPQPIMHPVYVPSPASQPAPGATACLAIESTFLYIFFLYCGAVQFSKLGFVKRRPAARSRQGCLASGRRARKKARKSEATSAVSVPMRFRVYRHLLAAPVRSANVSFFMPMPAKAFLLFHTVHTSYKYILYTFIIFKNAAPATV